MRSAFNKIGLILLSLMIAACSTKACYDKTEALVTIGLYASGTGAAKKSTSLKVTGDIDPVPIELVNTTIASYFSFPLDPVHEAVTLFITLDGFTDTAFISYNNYPHLISPECGYTFLSEITGLNSTHNIIDSLIIETKSVTLNGERNLRLFY